MITPKKKICSECQKESYIFSKGRCKPCAAKSYGKPKAISDKREKELKTYSQLRKQFLIKHPICSFRFEDCLGAATEVHHTKGRENDRLNDEMYWKSTCRSCHRHGHDVLSAAEARKVGFRV